MMAYGLEIQKAYTSLGLNAATKIPMNRIETCQYGMQLKLLNCCILFYFAIYLW